MANFTGVCPPAPSYLGVLYVATAGQNGANLGVDEEKVVLLSLAIIQRDGKKVLSTTNFLVHPRGTVKAASSDINENNSGETGILSEECRAELGLTDEEIKEKAKPLEEVISELDAIIKNHVAPIQIQLSTPFLSPPTPSDEPTEDHPLSTPIKEEGEPASSSEATSEHNISASSSSEKEVESSPSPSPLHLPFAFITEGQLPLRQCIHPEASTKDIRLPEYYYSFLDLKKEFSSCYDDAHQGIESVKEMVKFLELKLSKEEDDVDGEADKTPPRPTEESSPQTEIPKSDEGEGDSEGKSSPSEVKQEENCEEEGSKNRTVLNSYKRRITEMTAVVMRMLEDATTFQRPEIIMKKLEPGICSKNECVDGNCVVRARGLPWQSSDQDIAKFFRGLNIAKGGVALCLSPQGRRNGEALIRFESQEHRDMALKRHKHHIANRYIEVYKASGEDFLSVAGGKKKISNSDTLNLI